MFKSRSFYYIVDKLTVERAQVIRKGLEAIAGIEAVKITVNRGMVEIRAKRDMEEQVQLACQVSGAIYRTRAQL
ncbi:hypothetical protein [Salinispira pacifica]